MVSDELIQGITVKNHADETSHVTQRNDGVSPNRQVLLAGLWINLAQSIDQAEQLHDSLILSDVLVTLE